MDEIIIAEKLKKAYRYNTSLEDITFSVKEGEILGIYGREGAGKTSLLKILSGLSCQTDGVLMIHEKDGKRARISAMIGEPALYDRMTAYENLNIKRLASGLPDDSEIDRLLTFVGLKNWRDKRVREFSPGMKLRLSIAMAFLGDPDIVLLDEPMRGLDNQGIHDLRIMISRMNKEKNTTFIVTADSLPALSGIAGRSLMMDRGRFAEEGRATVFCETNFTGFSYIRLVCEPLSEAKKVLDSMEIYAYQTKTPRMLHILEQTERIAEIRKNITDAGVSIAECVLCSDDAGTGMKGRN